MESIGRFPSQRATNAGSVSMSWRHQGARRYFQEEVIAVDVKGNLIYICPNESCNVHTQDRDSLRAHQLEAHPSDEKLSPQDTQNEAAADATAKAGDTADDESASGEEVPLGGSKPSKEKKTTEPTKKSKSQGIRSKSKSNWNHREYQGVDTVKVSHADQIQWESSPFRPLTHSEWDKMVTICRRYFQSHVLVGTFLR